MERIVEPEASEALVLRGQGARVRARLAAQMRWLRVASVLAILLAFDRAAAFHTGGVGECEGCHTMHGKADGSATGPSLLLGSDPSSTCLTCHGGNTPSSYQVLTTNVSPGFAPVHYTPGGDFAWLGKTFSWMGASGPESSPGERHGHSVVAGDFGLFSDVLRTTAPGGSYPSDQLTCVSCHDPHGRYRLRADQSVGRDGAPIVASGSYGGADLRLPGVQGAVGAYRLLGGAGYAPKSAGAVIPFLANPPVALSPREYDRSERLTDTRVAYGSGMSEWCGNCHADIHTGTASSGSVFKHPAGLQSPALSPSTARLTAGGEAAIYNNYVRTGVLTGTSSTSYTSMVPFEEGTSDRALLATHAVSDGTATTGPVTGNETVMCLSCHRAHATAWDHALRWNMPQSGTIVFAGAWPGVDAPGVAGLAANAQGRTQAETRAGMYDREASAYASFQKVLCNKCHAQD